MKLLPFESFATDDGIVCPMCNYCHAQGGIFNSTITKFCVLVHAPGQTLDLTTLSSERVPHLDRTCRRCGYQWQEETCAPMSHPRYDV